MTAETWGIVGAIFGAGVAWATMKQRVEKNERDLNGVGKKYGRLVGLLIRQADTQEKREQLAQAVEPPK